MDIKYNYIYLLQTREFVESGKPIYKLGKTTKPLLTRFNQYPKGSRLILQIECPDCDYCEKKLLELFRAKYVNKPDYGREYFEGNFINMLNDVTIFIINEYNLDAIKLFEPKKSTKPIETVKTIGTGKLIKLAEPVKPIEIALVKPIKIIETVELIKPVKPKKVVKTVNIIKPDEPYIMPVVNSSIPSGIKEFNKYCCERCLRAFKCKITLIKHLQNKTECICIESQKARDVILCELTNKESNILCTGCNKKFSNLYTLNRHQKHSNCKQKNIDTLNDKVELMHKILININKTHIDVFKKS
jgi:hypothetical protein